MAKAVLTTKIDPTYDDLPEQRYHFPRAYLRQVEAAKGDFVVYFSTEIGVWLHVHIGPRTGWSAGGDGDPRDGGVMDYVHCAQHVRRHHVLLYLQRRGPRSVYVPFFRAVPACGIPGGPCYGTLSSTSTR